MITFKKDKLSQKEKSEITSFLYEMNDVNSDFYITKNNLRLFIKDNADLLFECVEEGDYLVYDENGIALINGLSDDRNRKYLKVLVKNPKEIERLLKVLLWQYNEDLYIKIKKNNPIKTELMKNGFKFLGGRGKETLLFMKGRKYASNNKTEN